MICVRQSLPTFFVFAVTLSPALSAQSQPSHRPGSGGKQHPATKALAPPVDLSGRLAEMEKTLTKQSAEGHVAGFSLVVVKDGMPNFIKGIGMKDLEHKRPVTPDTLFAIGSSSKAFTAMTMMMSVDDGKLSLSDPPRKYLPYFKLQDPDAARR